jgi:hypothetical protein
MPIRCFFLCVVALAFARAGAGEFRLEDEPGVLTVLRGDRLVVEYRYDDPDIPRPFFANIHAPNGELITRSFPADGDHADMHPGLWLSFGDIDGADFWRNKATTRHLDFIEAPRTTARGVRFAAKHVYEGTDEAVICEEVLRFEIRDTEHGYFLLWDSTFTSAQAFTFGDQEEMGLGFRVKPELSVEFGTGAIVNDRGEKNGAEVWGKTARWCDYSGTNAHGGRTGITLMPHPENFAPSWMHARDYGLLVANAFGRNAMTGGAMQSTKVQPGGTLRLRYGLYVYGGEALRPDEAMTMYLGLAK